MYARDIRPSLAHTCTDVSERQRLAAWPTCALSFLDVSMLYMWTRISFWLVVAIVLDLACISSAMHCDTVSMASVCLLALCTKLNMVRHMLPYLLYPEALVI